MRQFKVVLLSACALALAVGTGNAGLNPASPGIPGNNNLSNACIECHTQTPGGATHQGSHFVYNTALPAYSTHSGGGGSYNLGGAAREAGEYFKVTAWAQGGFSKYGRISDNSSISRANDNATFGAAKTATDAEFQGGEIICESCHNLVHNVQGGNNLLAPMTSATVNGTAQVLAAAVGTPATNAPEAPLCVGCHGFMYTGGAAPSPSGTYYADSRNNSDFGGAKKGNNNAHYINGVKMAQNHHVGTGDPIANSLAAQGYLWRDVLSVPTDGEVAAINTSTATTRGQMPQQASWSQTDGSIKLKPTNPLWLNCMNCHAEPHSGLNGTAASILRDQDAGGTFTSTSSRQDGILRIGEASRGYMGFSDTNYCNDCHTVATGK
jgi:hypothetical protein